MSIFCPCCRRISSRGKTTFHIVWYLSQSWESWLSFLALWPVWARKSQMLVCGLATHPSNCLGERIGGGKEGLNHIRLSDNHLLIKRKKASTTTSRNPFATTTFPPNNCVTNQSASTISIFSLELIIYLYHCSSRRTFGSNERKERKTITKELGKLKPHFDVENVFCCRLFPFV